MKQTRVPEAMRRRSAARLACVQGLYEMDVSGAPSDPVLQAFIAQRWSRMDGEAKLQEPDAVMLGRLVRGVAERTAELDARISEALSSDRSVDRLDVLVRAVLRAGAYELVASPEVPANVVINEYVDVAHAFFDGSEPALVNGVLDRLARTCRPADNAESAHEPSP